MPTFMPYIYHRRPQLSSRLLPKIEIDILKFPLPLWERVGVRVNVHHLFPSPQSPPARGEEFLGVILFNPYFWVAFFKLKSRENMLN